MSDNSNDKKSSAPLISVSALPAFVVAIINLVGMPGLVIVAWVGAILFDKYRSDHLIVWGVLMIVSAVYSMFTFLKAARNNTQEQLYMSTKSRIEQDTQLNRLAELCTEMLKINKEVYATVSVQLSAKHVVVLLPIFIEAFKWKLITTIVPAYDDLVRSGKNSDMASYMQVSQMYLDTLMMPLIKQHMFFKDAYVEQQFCKCIDSLFLYIQSPEFSDMDVKEKQDRAVIQKINMICGDMYKILNDYLETAYTL
jgi:hypothetical protein